jgi:hypothetical protein
MNIDIIDKNINLYTYYFTLRTDVKKQILNDINYIYNLKGRQFIGLNIFSIKNNKDIILNTYMPIQLHPDFTYENNIWSDNVFGVNMNIEHFLKPLPIGYGCCDKPSTHPQFNDLKPKLDLDNFREMIRQLHRYYQQDNNDVEEVDDNNDVEEVDDNNDVEEVIDNININDDIYTIFDILGIQKPQTIEEYHKFIVDTIFCIEQAPYVGKFLKLNFNHRYLEGDFIFDFESDEFVNFLNYICKKHHILDFDIYINKTPNEEYLKIDIVVDDSKISNFHKIEIYKNKYDFFESKEEDKKYKLFENNNMICAGIYNTENIIDKDAEIDKLKKENEMLKQFYIC